MNNYPTAAQDCNDTTSHWHCEPTTSSLLPDSSKTASHQRPSTQPPRLWRRPSQQHPHGNAARRGLRRARIMRLSSATSMADLKRRTAKILASLHALEATNARRAPKRRTGELVDRRMRASSSRRRFTGSRSPASHASLHSSTPSAASSARASPHRHRLPHHLRHHALQRGAPAEAIILPADVHEVAATTTLCNNHFVPLVPQQHQQQLHRQLSTNTQQHGAVVEQIESHPGNRRTNLLAIVRAEPDRRRRDHVTVSLFYAPPIQPPPGCALGGNTSQVPPTVHTQSPHDKPPPQPLGRAPTAGVPRRRRAVGPPLISSPASPSSVSSEGPLAVAREPETLPPHAAPGISSNAARGRAHGPATVATMVNPARGLACVPAALELIEPQVTRARRAETRRALTHAPGLPGALAPLLKIERLPAAVEEEAARGGGVPRCRRHEVLPAGTKPSGPSCGVRREMSRR